MTLKHNRGDFLSISEIGDTGFDYFDTRVGNFGLYFVFDAVDDHFAGTAQTAFVGYPVPGRIYVGRYVVGVNAYDIAKCAVALKRELFFVVVYVKYRFRRVHYAPHDGYTDFYGVAQTVVDLLAVVVKRHDFK